MNNGWWNFSIPNGFPPLSLYEAEKRGFRRILYQWWRPNNCEVHGFSIICGVGPYLDTLHLRSIQKSIYTRKYVLFTSVISAYCVLHRWNFLLDLIAFLPENCCQTKSWYILVNTPTSTIEKISVYFSWRRKTIYCLSLCKHVLFLQFLFSQLVDFFTRDALKS